MINNDNSNRNNNHNNNFRENQNQNEIRNEIIIVNQSENNRINRINNNNHRRQIYNNTENYNYRDDEYDLFFECNEESGCKCFLIFLSEGLGTFIVWIIEKNSFLWLLGIFNLLLFVFFFVLFFVINIDYSFNPLLFDYSFVFVAIGPVFSFYTGIFHSIFTCNPNKPQLLQKEKKIISLIYNIFIPGSGTLLYRLSKICERNSCCSYCWKRYRHILYGLIIIIGFVIFLLSLFFENNKIKTTFFVIGIISYCFSLFSGISINISCYDELLFS